MKKGQRRQSGLNEVEQIMEKLKENMEFLREKYKVKSLGVFGSYVRGEQKKKKRC